MTQPKEIGNLTGLGEDDLELFEYLLEEEGVAGLAPARAIVPRERRDEFPLSFAQQRLWFLDQLSPRSPAYNMAGAVRLEGPLDTVALERSLNEVVRRHEVLRATFRADGGEPVQLISPSLGIELPVIDLGALPETRRRDAARRLTGEEARRPFDLAAGPLLRAELLRLSDDEHVLLLTMHHIVSDGWSVALLTRELSALYGAYIRGAESPLPELSIQYADYAAWQREQLTGAETERQLSYWRERLGGELPVLRLPTDHARSSTPRMRGATCGLLVARETSERLRALAHDEGASPFMLLLAAFKTLLWRYTGQDDVVVGVPSANRDRPEIEPLVGFFVNTLVLRTDLSGGPTFRELLRRVRETALGAYAHAELPFERLVEELRPERDPGHTPLFQVMFSMQNAAAPALSFPGLRASVADTTGETAKFELSLDFQETGNELSGVLQYDADLFEEATAARLTENFRTLLEAVARHPDAPIARLPLLSPTEADRLLALWNETRAPYPRGVGLHRLFEIQAAKRPEAVALISEDERLTYAELDRRANQLAHYLRQLGVGLETRVGVLSERSTQLVVALLGILKAGAAYVPLDAEHPPTRLAFMLADARVQVLLTRNYPADKLPPHGARVVAFETEAETIEREDGAQPPHIIDPGPDQLAYVMYTSGSTGRPKGVMVTHAGLVNSVWSRQQIHPLTAEDRTLLKTPLGFDASVWELFWPLAFGASVVIARPAGQRDTSYLRDTIIRQDITTLYFVPSLLSIFLEEEGLEAATGVSQLISGGESLPARTVRRFYERFPQARLHHSYGPTETSIGSTEWTCAPGLERPTAHIGRPVANTRLYVLDRFINPVPVGVTGELFVGGDGVARGYAGRPAQTAERFVPDSYSGESGARLYRTGDLVRYLADGNVEFLGRVDSQVKLRGLRVEPGEVEAALSGHTAVGECAVVAREDDEGDKRLVAYVVGVPPESLTADELRGFLRSKLPEYMVPARYVFLEALPLLASGKVDRKALPAPELERTATGGEYVAPRTPIEEVVAGIWGEVLGVERVGVRDNFFDLGGHSLLATRVVSRVREALGVELALTRFFEIPVVAELAQEVETQLRPGVARTQSALRAVPRDDAPPLSFAQRRLWFLHQLEPDSPFYNTFDAVRLEGPLDMRALAAALSEVVRRHEILRTTFRVLEGDPVQFISPPRRLEIPVVDLTGVAEREREARRLAALEAKRPFDLAAGPLVRATLLRLGAQSHVFVVVMHHIVSDGWSIGVLTRELSALYAAFVRGEGSPLAELPIQYADYAGWQREQLGGGEAERQLRYWRERLSGAAPALELPPDRPRPAAPSLRGAAVSFELPGSLTGELKALSRREGVTLFMTLSAAFRALLYRYTGQADISVGTPIAGRTRAEVEPLIGFFVNTLVLRAEVRGAESFRRLLKRERETCLGAYAHSEVPFERVVEELGPERDLSRTPLFQVMFVLQNAPAETPRLPGLSLAEMALDSTTAKFDWMMSLEETGQGLRGILEYSTDLFDETTIRRALESFRVLLEGVARDAETPVSALPLLTPEEERRMLFEWNDTSAEFPRGVCVHELFEAQAEHTPEATAVVYGDERLSYRELNTRADHLAGYLRTRGVGPESVVGVMVERSSEMIVALLGILKAGAAYVPFDAEHPPTRLAFMLADARVQVLLTQERLLGRLPEYDARAICLDADWESIAATAGRPPGARAAGGNLAYVIYTSGSTGRPKAVMMPHAAAVNLIEFQLRSDAAPRPPRTLQFASLSFDVSFQEIFTTLCAGATLVLIDEESRRDAARLLRVLEKERVERLFLPFVALQYLAEAAEVGGTVPSSLLEVITAGEQLKITSHIQRLFERLGHALLDNHYGPTETHLATMWRLGGSAREWPPLPPIGRPISNARVYVLDAGGRPAPLGVVGELYIGGAQLARGYLHRPAQTAERFVPDSYSGEPGARLYRTGDLARYLPDGCLEYIGRSDHQVKVRGFRVEIGEVEATLKRHAAVGQAAVAALTDKAGGHRLVAYVVRGQGAAATADELRDFLKERLPEYMVPARYVFLEALPLLASGKVDRGRLPTPESAERQASEYATPRTAVEEVLAGVWAEVLGVERVGVTDNFFDHGGHSLLATQLISRLRAVFQVEIPLRCLFQQPTPAGLAPLVEAELSAGKRTPLPPVRAVARDGAAPLSFAQQRLWFLDKLEPASPFYNLPAALRIEGALDTAALERSLGEIVRRHEILRTIFPVVEGRPAQLLAPDASIRLKQIDLSHLSPTEKEQAVRQHAQDEARWPFDLATGPLTRAALLRLSPREHVLLLTLHHIVCDGWSIGVLTRELSALYAAFVRGEGSPLAELPIQYADYAGWQREQLGGGEAERQLRYWRERLSGAAPALELPPDRPRPAVQTYRGERHAFALPASVAEEIRAYGRREGATLFMTLLAAFQALLQRYTGQEEVSVGTPVANRGRAETADLIGFFVNTLVLRTEFDGDPTFTQLLGRVREVCLGAYAHSEVPFERVVEELGPERDLSRTPLFQVMFVLQNAPAETPRLPGLELRVLEIEGAAARFDLTLEMTETGDGLRGEFTYNADLFKAATVARLSEHFANLLRAVASEPGERVSRLRLSSPEELRQLLSGWNGARADYPPARCIQELFEDQAGHTPDAVAVRSDEESLSYRELNERANQLARYLRRLGVGPESKVGVSLERSAEMIVCLLGVLKAGAAYVPLSPAYPRERLAFLVADAGVQVLIRRRRQAEGETPDETRVVALEDEREQIARESRGNLPPTATPDHLAYVIYTSGSTGRPKGVEVTHRGLVHSTQARLAFYGGGVRCFLLVSPFVFDSSVAGIFWTLCAGSVLALPPEDFQRDLARFVGELARHGVSDLLCLPSLYALLLEQGARAEFESLQRVIVAGEVCPGELVGRHFETLPRTLLFNEYGPTEGTVWSTVHRCIPEDSAARVPIGRPVADVRTYVLDAGGRPAPLGVVGELYIGGAQLARGYLHRPAQTAERFVPDSYSGEPGARLYRTGDLARYLPDGQLEFLGRADEQVKIRGYRVEPGEIEATLVSHERVREALVVVREEGRAGPRLVGYVVPSAAPPTVGELRAFLKERLPEYMTPSVFVMLEELPRTTSGKPDRRRLPAPDASRPTLDAVYVAPQTQLEQEVAAVWREVLGLEQVGVRDNFFDLGGHSLLIVEAHLKLRERLGREIPVVALFSHPTVEALARHLSREGGEPPAETDGSSRAAARRASLGARTRGGGVQPD